VLRNESERRKNTIKYTIKNIRIVHEKLKSKKPRSRTQIYYIIREIAGEEKRTSQPLHIYNSIHTLICI